MIKAFSLLLLLCSFGLHAQIETINGYIQDCQTKENLVNASVFLKKNNAFVYTNSQGYFSLSGITFPDTIEISYIGYATKIIAVKSGLKSTDFCLRLSNKLDEVVIKSRKSTFIKDIHAVDVNVLESLPAIGGEVDILKALTFLPGVASGQEGTSQFYVRGGDADQNLVLLDGIPVYNLYHLGGYFSFINNLAVKNIQFYKGDIPAKYGNRLSSVLDITLKDGNKKQFQGYTEIGVLTSKLLLEIPIVKDTSSLMLSGRSSYLGLVNLFRDKDKTFNYLDYWLYDIYAKYHTLVGRGQLNITYFTGTDSPQNYINSKVLFPKKDSYEIIDNRLKWHNNIVSVRYSQPLLNRLYLNATIGYSNYKTTQSSIASSYIIDQVDPTDVKTLSDRYDLNSYIARVQLDYNVTRWISLYSGVNVSINSMRFDSELNNLSVYKSETYYETVSPYLNVETKLKNSVVFNTGVHSHINYFNGDKSITYAPRFSATYQPSKRWKLTMGAHRNFQFLNDLVFANYGLNYNTFTHQPDNIPVTSWQFQAGVQHSFKSSSISVFGFRKSVRDYYDLRIGESIQQLTYDLEGLELKNGLGWGHGVEVSYAYVGNSLDIRAGYTFLIAKRQFANFNEDNSYDFDYARKHDFNITSILRLGEKWSLSGAFIVKSGRPITFPVRRIYLPGNHTSEVISEGQNLDRTPVYHRMDLAIKHEKITTKKNKRIWTFSIYNIYNHKNANEVAIKESIVTDDQANIIGKTYRKVLYSNFPIIPSLNFGYEF